MKEFFKKYTLWVIIIFALIMLFMMSKDYWMEKGENRVKDYYNEKLTEYTTDTQKGYAEKDKLIENAVKEKLDDRATHHQEITELETKHLKYREKIRTDFQELNTKLANLTNRNNNLKADVLSLRATLLSFSLANKQLTIALNEVETKMISDYNTIIEKIVETVEEKYINFLKKVNTIKKSKRSWRKND